jgi:phage baseplate assembly protein gpV
MSIRALQWSSRASRLAAGVLVCVVLGACGGDSDDAAGTTTTAPTTTAPSTSTSAASGGDDVWRRDATANRGKNGERFTIECTPDGTEDSIWGVETYTDDSSICTAAVHVGLITFEDGGDVEYEIAPGLDEYDGKIGNGVLSTRYGKYDGSFVFPDAPPGSGEFTVGPESWQRKAVDYQRETGEQVTVECAPGGPVGSVWGTGTYTGDSSICTAAVHTGLIALADGGTVTIQIAPGADAYEGTTANGVTSSEYGPYNSSFTFAADQPGG